MQPVYATSAEDAVAYSPTQMAADGQYAVLPAQAHRNAPEMAAYDALAGVEVVGAAATSESGAVAAPR